MEKNGMLTDKSKSDFDMEKKAEYYDADGFLVADEHNKHKLTTPRRLTTVPTSNNKDRYE